MTRKTRRELERDVADLAATDADDGFYHFIIGGDPDAPEGGHYRWDEKRGVYVNDEGHEVPPEDAPPDDSEFEYNIKFGGTDDDE